MLKQTLLLSRLGGKQFYLHGSLSSFNQAFPRQVRRTAGWLIAVIRQRFDAGPALAQHGLLKEHIQKNSLKSK